MKLTKKHLGVLSEAKAILRGIEETLGYEVRVTKSNTGQPDPALAELVGYASKSADLIGIIISRSEVRE